RLNSRSSGKNAGVCLHFCLLSDVAFIRTGTNFTLHTAGIRVVLEDFEIWEISSILHSYCHHQRETTVRSSVCCSRMRLGTLEIFHSAGCNRRHSSAPELLRCRCREYSELSACTAPRRNKHQIP